MHHESVLLPSFLPNYCTLPLDKRRNVSKTHWSPRVFPQGEVDSVRHTLKNATNAKIFVDRYKEQEQDVSISENKDRWQA